MVNYSVDEIDNVVFKTGVEMTTYIIDPHFDDTKNDLCQLKAMFRGLTNELKERVKPNKDRVCVDLFHSAICGEYLHVPFCYSENFTGDDVFIRFIIALKSNNTASLNSTLKAKVTMCKCDD